MRLDPEQIEGPRLRDRDQHDDLFVEIETEFAEPGIVAFRRFNRAVIGVSASFGWP